VPAESLLLREAVPSDISVLVKHRCWMFDDMLVNQKVGFTAADVDAMEAPYEAYLQEHFGGLVRAWVVEDGGQVVASGAILFNNWAPRPGDHTGKSALLHSVYTDPAYRRQGQARRIMDAMLAECARLGLHTVNLHASDAGRPMYETMGFKQTSEMRLFLK
jgi:GNAT superfamily N-acetyltransferase